jgi:PAS domain S-box-containing protein
LSRVVDRYRRRQAGEDVPKEYDIVLLRKDKSRVYVRLNSGIIKYRGRVATISTLKDVTLQRATTAAFVETESRYKALFEQAADSIFVVNPENGEIIDFNQRAYTDLGYTKDEFSSLTLYDIVAEDDPDTIMINITKAIQEEGYTFESVHKTKQHELKDVRVSLRPISLHGTRVVQGIVRDITENKQTSQILEEAEERYRKLFDAANDAIFLVDVDGRVIECNKKALDMFGCTIDDIIGRAPYEFSPEFQPNGTRSGESSQVRMKSVLEGESQFFGWVHKKLDGSLFDAEVSLNVISLSGKKIIQAIVRDVTERKAAVEAIQQSEEEYRMLINHLPVVSWTTDIHGNTIFISPNVELIYGFKQDEIYGGGSDLWLGRIHSEDVDRVKEQYQKLFDEGVQLDIEYRIQRKDGKWIWLHDTSSGIYEKDGNFYASGAFSDITEEKHNSDLLQRQKDELSELGHMMSHDLGNKMYNISALIEIYKMTKDEEILDRISASTMRAGDLLKLSAELAEEGLVIHEKTDVDLDAILKNIAENAIPDSVAIELMDLPIVSGNERRIEQIFHNVILNAIEHGNSNRISIRFQKVEGRESISIANNGTPIPENIRPKVFTRGFSTVKERKGLGLSIVKKLVEAHGWSITLKDSVETVFRIDLN